MRFCVFWVLVLPYKPSLFCCHFVAPLWYRYAQYSIHSPYKVNNIIRLCFDCRYGKKMLAPENKKFEFQILHHISLPPPPPWLGLQWNQSIALCVLAMAIRSSIFIIWGYTYISSIFISFGINDSLLFFSLLILVPEIFRSGYWKFMSTEF